jgi:hypothetical protein
VLALLHEETEGLAPYWLAVAAMCLFGLGSALWEPSYVLEPLGQRFSTGVNSAGTVWVLGFLVGQGAVAHELREGHIELLDALPVRRSVVFAVKLAACTLPILALVVGSFTNDLMLAYACRPPGAASPLQPAVVLHLVMLACGIGGLGVGALLSWLGPLAWGVLGVCAMGAMCANIVYPPSHGWLPLVGSLGDLEWEGTNARHPLGPPFGMVISGLLAMTASGMLFLGPGRALIERGSQAVAAVRTVSLGVVGLVALAAGSWSAYALLSEEVGPLWEGTRSLYSARGDFRVLHAPSNEPHAKHMASTVDELSDRVALLLGHVSEGGEPKRPAASGQMDIELLGTPKHHLGVFTGGKIRLEPSARDRTLAHELAHAHAFALAGPGAYYQRDGTHFFQEGLAEWVEALVAGRAPVGPLAGAIHETGQAHFEELVDAPRHLARHDVQQSYALGAAFVSALVEVGGGEALPCSLREVGRSGSRPVAGLALWHRVASRCGFDLDAVLDHWLSELREARTQIPGPLPRLRVSVQLSGESPQLEVRDELERGWTLRCTFRRDSDTPRERWTYRKVENGLCEVPRERLSGHTFQYQVGFELPRAQDGRGRETLFLGWVEARAWGEP